MSRESQTCFSKVSGKALKEFMSQYYAQEAADYAAFHYNNKGLKPYLCSECEQWHLSPADRQTPSELCSFCTSGVGEPKQSYRNKKEAQMRADILYNEQGVELNVYSCPSSNGWHLTKA